MLAHRLGYVQSWPVCMHADWLACAAVSGQAGAAALAGGHRGEAPAATDVPVMSTHVKWPALHRQVAIATATPQVYSGKHDCPATVHEPDRASATDAGHVVCTADEPVGGDVDPPHAAITDAIPMADV